MIRICPLHRVTFKSLVALHGVRHSRADREAFDHVPTQRADGLLGYEDAPVLSEVVETPRSQDRMHPSATL